MPTFDTPEAIVATIDGGAGHVRINAGDRTDTVVEVQPTDASVDADVQAAEETRVEYANGHLSVTAPKQKLRSLFGRPGSIEVVIDLPTGSRVDADVWAAIRTQGRLGDSTFETAAGFVRLDQTGRLKVRTAAGDVSIARSVGHTDVSTSSGKIRIGDVDGTATVKTSNGDITVGEVTGDLRLNTANGDITVERASAGVEAKTAYGSVRIGEATRGEVVLDTGFGELEVGVREGTAVWLDARSQFGTVRSDLGGTDEPGSSDETLEVRARTRFGDIEIRRSAPAV